jgi:hypothetical protein
MDSSSPKTTDDVLCNIWGAKETYSSILHPYFILLLQRQKQTGYGAVPLGTWHLIDRVLDLRRRYAALAMAKEGGNVDEKFKQDQATPDGPVLQTRSSSWSRKEAYAKWRMELKDGIGKERNVPRPARPADPRRDGFPSGFSSAPATRSKKQALPDNEGRPPTKDMQTGTTTPQPPQPPQPPEKSGEALSEI